MSTSPYMPLYIADYLADAAHLTTEEHGAYMLLIMTYWQRGKPLSADPARLANIARLPNGRWTDVERTLSEFFDVSATEWRHKRIESELQRYRDKVERAKMAGMASANSKKATGAKRTFNGRSTDAQRKGNHSESESDSKNKTPIAPKGAAARFRKTRRRQRQEAFDEVIARLEAMP